jgi:hypothetical protein
MTLADYRVTADEPSADKPIVALTCDTCAQHGRPGDIRWWERGQSPSIPDLIAEAERHEKHGHHP